MARGQPLFVMQNDYPKHTPELARLFSEMEKANETLAKVARKQGLAARRSPEYKTAMAAYRAYWNAVDADRAKAKA